MARMMCSPSACRLAAVQRIRFKSPVVPEVSFTQQMEDFKTWAETVNGVALRFRR